MRRRIFALAAVLGLCCCTATEAREQLYRGVLAGCGGRPSTLTRLAGRLAFAPDDGALVLHGTVAADGQFAAELNTQSAGKPPFVLRVSGAFAGDSARVSYVTPRCHADGVLKLAE